MIQEITATELKARLDQGEALVVIDIREDWELEITQVDFARHLPMSSLRAHLDDIPKDQSVVFICRSGSRSMQVAQALSMNGWAATKLFNLRGGILAWAREVDPSLPTHY
jgi:rhodanese-related sulfurtransferase